MKNTDFVDKLAFIMVSGYSIFTFIRGLFWFVEDDRVLDESQFYSALDNMMSMWIWGLIVMLISVILFIGAWLIPLERHNNLCQYFLVIGGLSACLMYFLMTSASMFNAINWLTWAQFAVLTAKSGAIAFIGGMMKHDR
ncbi:hypothetical protein [Staphylococcus haemolyticus]|uniref:hypothetical protein n=1 Tax=Staphylococcus haemolyticus TaxID=1283 RepID=UPI000D1F0DB0|nr:hypothetical protein [Staphylococcus haemolyticus]PTK69147.1 hypothetical protein BUZ32_02980 [Staphylococcus haemolyticus]